MSMMNEKRCRRAAAIAKGRDRILTEWHEALALRGHRSKDQVTESFLARLARSGKIISRRTLYVWEQRRIAGGLPGLADGRGEPIKAGPKLLKFDLPGVKLNVRVAGATVDIRQGHNGLVITLTVEQLEGSSKAL